MERTINNYKEAMKEALEVLKPMMGLDFIMEMEPEHLKMIQTMMRLVNASNELVIDLSESICRIEEKVNKLG